MKKGCYVSVGRCPTAGLRCRVGRFWTSATGRQHPSRRRDAGAVRRLRGQLASAPHNPVSPRRRLWRSSPVGSALRRPNRQVRTKGGTRLGRLDRKARRKPPWHRRCHQETPGEGFLRKTVHRTIFLFSCACWRYKTVGRCPTPCQLSFEKAGQRTLPAYGAHVR